MELYQEGVRGVFKNRLNVSAKFGAHERFLDKFFSIPVNLHIVESGSPLGKNYSIPVLKL